MFVLDLPRETLDTTVEFDDSTRLPLFAEQEVIFELILAYLPLPYSVAEFGCGKKTSLILEQLLLLELPPYALERGMIMEQDMSRAALAELDADKRPGALTIDNPLTQNADLRDPKLRAILDANCVQVSADGDAIQAGPFTLRHRPRVQFLVARSHIFPMVWFWDDEERQTVLRVLDPTIDSSGFFPIEKLRDRLSAPESLIFTASLLDRFRLHEEHLTPAQARRVEELAGDVSLFDQPYEEHARLIRQLTGAEEGTVGDPREWTYVNNVLFGDIEHDERQRDLTGRGEPLRLATKLLFEARQEHGRDVADLRGHLVDLAAEMNLWDTVRLDADVAEHHLQPLAEVANTVSYYRSLRLLAEQLADGRDGQAELLAGLSDLEALDEAWGFGVSLRSRLEKLAAVSEDELGRIDARALNDRFIAATVETIRQMNRAGLDAFVDRVGNLHGLWLDDATRRDLAAGRVSLAELCQRAICHVSHIDTVEDGGKYDGRLGVLSGVEIIHILSDLKTYFDRIEGVGRDVLLLVSAFIGEEMTFTGEGVSMPGSAAVAGLASAEQVHAMTNGDGERFGDRLLTMLHVLRREQEAGRLVLSNDFSRAGDAAELLAACFEPTDFFTPRSYERHIEQGPVLDRVGVPLVLVETIMGIHQEDFFFSGTFAEPAALEMNLRCRELLLDDPDLHDVRLTVGILQEMGDDRCFEQPAMAIRWELYGERNHAGGTALEDRRDPGVAAGRLARELRRWVAAYNHNQDAEERVLPLIGEARLSPGTSRNVIPGTAVLKVGVQGEMPKDRQAELDRELRGFVFGQLFRPVTDGGEGVLFCDAHPASFLNTSRRVQLSVDLRAAEQPTMDRCRASIAAIVEQLKGEFRVEVTSSVEQQVPPRPLARTGQVLQIERSYGGSHNPNEMELARDLVRGTVLQLAVARDVLARGSVDDLDLFALVRSRLPESWRRKIDGFVSGALHDTCNVATAAGQRGQRPALREP